MARKKNAEDQLTAEEQALHQRVYEMMDLDRSKELEAARVEKAKSSEPAPIDIFKDLKVEAPVAKVEPAEPAGPVEPPEPQPESVSEPEPAPEPVEEPIKPVEKVAKPEVSKASTKKPASQPIDIEDAAIDKVVDEILISESDDLLAAEDIIAQIKTLPDSPKPKSKIRRLFSK